MAGLIIPHENGYAIAMVEKLEDLVTLLLLPIDRVVFLTTTHLIVGALMLVTGLALTIHSYRLSERRSQLAARCA